MSNDYGDIMCYHLVLLLKQIDMPFLAIYTVPSTFICLYYIAHTVELVILQKKKKKCRIVLLYIYESQ